MRFHDYNDRKLIWNKRREIPGKTISLSENYANNVERKRRLLYPIMKKARDSNKFQKVYIKNDKLILDDKKFGVDKDMEKLPTDLHPRHFSLRTNQDWIIFGGIHSAYTFLSNYSYSPITYKGVKHDTVESCYQYAKALRYGDTEAGEMILCASTPAKAKYIGNKVRKFRSADWDSVKEGIMLNILRQKFRPGTDEATLLKRTTGKSIAEAGKSKTFAIGLSLNNKNIFEQNLWPKDCNLLGRLLMQVRTELNNK